jgi:hypothetical protein
MNNSLQMMWIARALMLIARMVLSIMREQRNTRAREFRSEVMIMRSEYNANITNDKNKVGTPRDLEDEPY